jgi:hypothetical protein
VLPVATGLSRGPYFNRSGRSGGNTEGNTEAFPPRLSKVSGHTNYRPSCVANDGTQTMMLVTSSDDTTWSTPQPVLREYMLRLPGVKDVVKLYPQ